MKIGNQTTPEFNAYSPQLEDVISLQDLFTGWEEREENLTFKGIESRYERGLYYIGSHRSDIEPTQSYAKPCMVIIDYLRDHNIYGEPKPKDISFDLVTRGDGTVLFMKYTHIIGCKALCYVK